VGVPVGDSAERYDVTMVLWTEWLLSPFATNLTTDGYHTQSLCEPEERVLLPHAYDIETLKALASVATHGIDGGYGNVTACESTAKQTWRRFLAASGSNMAKFRVTRR
jgi:hypothetical protein